MISNYSKWVTGSAIRLSEKFVKSVGGQSLVLNILACRGYVEIDETLAFLNPEYYQSTPVEELPGLIGAVNRIYSAVENRECICILGDHDVESQTATAILFSVLKALEVQAFYCIRSALDKSSYICQQILSQIIYPDQIVGEDPRFPKCNWPKPSLLITCGLGIKSYESISLARDHGVDVIILYDRDLSQVFLDAIAVVNPKSLPSDHPLNDLPCVGVIYKIVECLYKRVNQFEELEQILDLVAVGILADNVKLRGDTRYLLQKGLAQLVKPSRVGFEILFKQLNIRTENINEAIIRYRLIPRLNVLSHSSDTNALIEFLLTEDKNRARVIGYQMESLYQQKESLVVQGIQSVVSRLDQDPKLLQHHLIFLPDINYPESILGIMAYRFVEMYMKPVILISASEDQICRGIARSLEGVNLLNAIKDCAEIIEDYDGHSLAIGFRINKENIELFYERISQLVISKGERPETELIIDGEVSLSDIDLDFIEDVERLAPFGLGNPYPTLIGTSVIIGNINEFGRNSEHLRLKIVDEENNKSEVIWWSGGLKSQLPINELVDLAFRVRSTDYHGKKGVFVDLIDIRPAQQKNKDHIGRQKVQVIDYRQSLRKFEELSTLSKNVDCKIFAEGQARGLLENKGIVAFNRYTLQNAKHLVIWNSPVSQASFVEILKKANPDFVYLFDNPTENEHLAQFMKKLSGYIKFALSNYGGRLDIQVLAANTAHLEVTVLKGIELLIARGDIDLLDQGEYWITVVERSGQTDYDLCQLNKILEELIEETNAFKSFYRRMPESIVNELLGKEK